MVLSAPDVNSHGCVGWNLQPVTPIFFTCSWPFRIFSGTIRAFCIKSLCRLRKKIRLNFLKNIFKSVITHKPCREIQSQFHRQKQRQTVDSDYGKQRREWLFCGVCHKSIKQKSYIKRGLKKWCQSVITLMFCKVWLTGQDQTNSFGYRSFQWWYYHLLGEHLERTHAWHWS